MEKPKLPIPPNFPPSLPHKLPIFLASADIFLRNYPDDDALGTPSKYSKALSFSPDIIPLYGLQVNPNALVSEASLRGFSGMPTVGGHVNNIHIRASDDGKGIVKGLHVATLRAVPSELILWPQVWKKINPSSPGPVVMRHVLKDDSESNKNRYVSDASVQFRPPHAPNQSHSLIAHVFKHDGEESTLKESSVENSDSVEGFLKFLKDDKEFTFHNVIVADPTLDHVAVSTRLRTLNFNIEVKFKIETYKGTRDFKHLEASLVDDRGKISITRTKVSTFSSETFKLVKYDGRLTLNLHAPSGQTLFEPYSGLSLKVFTANDELLGSLNIIFDHQSTRNLRFANNCGQQPRQQPKDCCKPGGGKNDHHYPNPPLPLPGPGPECLPIPYTTPAATGWWFRAQPNDTNNFPHAGPAGYSPDIQPVGTSAPDASIWKKLVDPSADCSVPDLVGNRKNYVFVRGHSTIADIDVQCRIYLIDGSAFLHPKQYQDATVHGLVWGDPKQENAQQIISVANDNQFYIFSTPFTVSPGADVGNHYCFVAEVRQKPKCRSVYPTWPTEQVEDFSTMTDYANWILSCPLVCQRNINWVPGTKGKNYGYDWTCTTKLVIPDCGSYCTFYTIIVECDNEVIMKDSKWELVCEDDTIFSDKLCFASQFISTGSESPAFAGCHFTGAPPGYSTKLIVNVNWYDGGNKIPSPNVKVRLAMVEGVADLSPIKHLTVPPPKESDQWAFYVGSEYPYIGKKENVLNPSPLPTFAKEGENTWPYPGVPNLVFGQVQMTAQVD